MSIKIKCCNVKKKKKDFCSNPCWSCSPSNPISSRFTRTGTTTRSISCNPNPLAMVPALIRANPSITKEKWGQDDCSLRPESNPYPFQFPPLLDDVIPVGCCRIILGDVTIHRWRLWGESVLTWGDTAPVADGLVCRSPFVKNVIFHKWTASLLFFFFAKTSSFVHRLTSSCHE